MKSSSRIARCSGTHPAPPQRGRLARLQQDPGEPQVFAVAAGFGAADHGCAGGPAAVRGQLRDPQSPQLRATRWDEIQSPRSGCDPATAVHQIALELQQKVRNAVVHGHRFVVIGGDHSCAIGTWNGAAAALGRQRPLGLVWIDAHMDAHTPQTSPSGRLHGMPLACLLDVGERRLVAPGGSAARLDPRHVTLLGVRSYEPAEAALLERLGVRVVTIEEVAHRGLAAALDIALKRATDGTGGFGISIDLDAIDPDDAPGVGSPVAGGLRGSELVAAMRQIGRDPRLLGAEVAELNPALDPDGRTARLARDLVVSLLYPAPAAAH